MRRHSIDVKDGRVFAVSAGSGDALLMLHGWPLDHRMFDRQLDALSDQFRVVAIDRRGFGQSSAPPNMGEELSDIDRIIDELDLGQVHLLGVSQGGRLALRYAASRPSRVKSLILLGAVVDGLDVTEPDEEKIPVAEYASLAQDGKLGDVVEHWSAHTMMQMPGGATAQKQLVSDMLEAYGGKDLVNFDASHYRFDGDILGALAVSRQQVLLLTGEYETDARKLHARAIEERVPNSKEVIIRGGGHLSNLTHPEPFNAAIRDFCSRVA
ncbi:MAG: alpha/beta hydrolase [Woeseiaceae bacterium]|nr:alpha/beta hydrolase [Woeseiaceae bacterium]